MVPPEIRADWELMTPEEREQDFRRLAKAYHPDGSAPDAEIFLALDAMRKGQAGTVLPIFPGFRVYNEGQWWMVKGRTKNENNQTRYLLNRRGRWGTQIEKRAGRKVISDVNAGDTIPNGSQHVVLNRSVYKSLVAELMHRRVARRPSASAEAGKKPEPYHPTLDTAAQAERYNLVMALKYTRGNKSKAALKLDIARSSLYSGIKRHGIKGTEYK